jgi:hypothetical protein
MLGSAWVMTSGLRAVPTPPSSPAAPAAAPPSAAAMPGGRPAPAPPPPPPPAAAAYHGAPAPGGGAAAPPATAPRCSVASRREPSRRSRRVRAFTYSATAPSLAATAPDSKADTTASGWPARLSCARSSTLRVWGCEREGRNGGLGEAAAAAAARRRALSEHAGRAAPPPAAGRCALRPRCRRGAPCATPPAPGAHLARRVARNVLGGAAERVAEEAAALRQARRTAQRRAQLPPERGAARTARAGSPGACSRRAGAAAGVGHEGERPEGATSLHGDRPDDRPARWAAGCAARGLRAALEPAARGGEARRARAGGGGVGWGVCGGCGGAGRPPGNVFEVNEVPGTGPGRGHWAARARVAAQRAPRAHRARTLRRVPRPPGAARRAAPGRCWAGRHYAPACRAAGPLAEGGRGRAGGATRRLTWSSAGWGRAERGGCANPKRPRGPLAPARGATLAAAQ